MEELWDKNDNYKTIKSTGAKNTGEQFKCLFWLLFTLIQIRCLIRIYKSK